MDGKIPTVLLTLVLPLVVIGVAIEWFSSNPLAILASFGAIVFGAIYLISYQEVSGAPSSQR